MCARLSAPIRAIWRDSYSYNIDVEPEALQSGFGVKCLFWPSEFRKIVGESLSEI